MKNRFKTKITPQLSVSLLAAALIIAGTALSLPSTPAPASELPAADSQLKVRPAFQRPGATIDVLQNARGLQSQQQRDLQRPVSSDAIQPNAKTDRFIPADKP